MRFSASTHIDRNLSILNVFPWRPTRVCRKNTGPPSHFTARASASSSGARGEQQERRADPVDDVLQHARDTVERRLGQPQQRKPVDRGDVQARAGHLHEARVDHQLGVRRLEVPGQVVQPPPGPARRLADRDDPVPALPDASRRRSRGRRPPAPPGCRAAPLWPAPVGVQTPARPSRCAGRAGSAG